MSPEHELKFVFRNGFAREIVSWLEGRCLPDPEYPKGRVNSIYYDLRDHRLLDEKRNSDFLKTKVRLRWYADVYTQAALDPVFLEVKFRRGGTRRKIHVRAPFQGHRLDQMDLASPELCGIERLLAPQGVMFNEALHPLLCISYRRSRFIEPATRLRICVDYDISVPRTNPRMLPRIHPHPLDEAVVEVKGPADTLPATLHPLTAMGCRKQSFSKYLACFNRLTQES